jgi:tRNA(Ile)-lysidine synthase
MSFVCSFKKKRYICIMFKHDIQKFIEEKSLFTLKDKVLVTLSGGADSVALLRVLLSLGYKCECAHCNFHLRGEESDRDEAFVKSLCEQLSVKLHIKHFETEAYAKTNHLSIEMAARELRYGWFHQLKEERNIAAIAVAHHRDDSVETFLLNLIRGTGIDGLKGILPKNGHVVRPLLQVSRESIIGYLKTIQQEYVTDSTNLEDVYTRNKIRLNILPLMKEINPSVMESVQETSRRLADIAIIYHQNRVSVLKESVVQESDNLYRIPIKKILQDVAPASFLYELLSPYGFNVSQIKDVHHCLVHSQSGKRFLSKEWEVIRDREELMIHRKASQLDVPELLIEEVKDMASFKLPRDKHIACLDADKVIRPLTIRKWKSGDKFIPLGMKGKKNVSDYLTDRKFSVYQKDNQYVVCSGETIVWLVDERIDNRFRVTDETERILIIQIKKGGQ